MPRKKAARRFDPLGGITQSMIQHECRYVLREIEDLQLGSHNDLRDRVEQRKRLCAEADAELRELLRALPELDRLAVAAVVLRDTIVALKLGSATILKGLSDRLNPSSSLKPVEPQYQPVLLKFSSTLFD